MHRNWLFEQHILSLRKTFVRASTLAVKSQRCFGKVAQVLNASCHQGEGRIPRRQPVPAAASSRQCLQGISKSAPHAASGHWKFLDTVVLLPGMSSGSRIQWESVYSQLLQLYSNVDRTRLWVVLFSIYWFCQDNSLHLFLDLGGSSRYIWLPPHSASRGGHFRQILNESNFSCFSLSD